MSRRSVYVAVCCLAVFFGVLFVRHATRAPHKHFCDFRVYFTAAERFLGRQDIYSQDVRSADGRELTPFKYSPFFALVLSPLVPFGIGGASLIFFTINFLSIGLLLYFIARLDDSGSAITSPWVFLFPILFTYRFALGALDSGQAAPMMLALIAGALLADEKDKPVLAGALLALSVVFKYMGVIFVPYLLIRRRYRAAFWTGFFLLVFCLLPAVWLGWNREMSFLREWLPSISANSLDRGSWIDYKNQSLYSLVLRSFMVNSSYSHELRGLPLLSFNSALWSSVFLAAMFYLLMIIPGRNKDKRWDIALLFAGLALFNPNAWSFNYLALVGTVTVLIKYVVQEHRGDDIVLGSLVISFILMNMGSESLVGDALQRLSQIYSSEAVGALVLVGALFYLKFSKQEARISSFKN